MTLRRVIPLIFVALCLGLSALVLHRQIAAHPVPRGSEAQADGSDPSLFPKTWHVVTEPTRREALNPVEGQLAALRTGDADKAMSYQSQNLRQTFRSSAEFERMIAAHYPAFGHSHSVDCGPVWTDPTGTYAGVVVTVAGVDGHKARALYLLIREGDGYKVNSVKGGGPVN